ncbi:MAG: MMPL family transporter, partial [Candidatus Zixiibacteriota bacterium]
TEVSGPVPLFVRMQQYVVRTQILSLSISFMAILVLFAIISSSWKSGLAAVLANSLAVIIILGIMGLCEIPLDVTTVMIAAVAIAISADDTIHFLHRYKAEMIKGTAPFVAVDNVFKVVGSPVISSTFLLTLGFAVLAFSDFVPIRNFGLLTGLFIVLALTADLVLIPALIRLLAGNRR